MKSRKPGDFFGIWQERKTKELLENLGWERDYEINIYRSGA